MNSCELVSLVTALSCAIAKCLPEDELPTVAAVLGQISSTLATIAVQDKANEAKNKIPEPASGTTPEINSELIPEVNSELIPEIIPDPVIIIE